VLFAEGLNYPSAMDWDARGRLHVLQSNTVPIPGGELKVVRIEGDAENARIVDVPLKGAGAPTGKVAIGLTFHGGRFYLSHEESDGTWGVSRFDPESGETEAVLRNLPGNGDHNVNYLAFDRAGALYFGVGSATNSGVSPGWIVMTWSGKLSLNSRRTGGMRCWHAVVLTPRRSLPRPHLPI
jgi:glucose/arabinose dehydrogenase